VRAAYLVLLVATAAHADTLGYQRVTPITDEVVIDKPQGASRAIVARTQTEWNTAWKAAGGTGAAKTIDFDRHMVVGIVNGAKEDRVIYRIQLDDAANAKALEVHLGAGDSPTHGGNTRKPTRAHFVVTPRSSLAVRFTMDQMVDAGVFGHSSGEGVDSKEVATVPAVRATPVVAKAGTREAAERAVIGQLSATERKELLKGPLGGPMTRVPHGWTDLEVTREANRWMIRYDKLRFHVDVATGAVTRP
jgi:hypothetical protein